MNQLPGENKLTTQDVASCDTKRLLAYIQAKLSTPLDIVDAERLLDAKIDHSIVSSLLVLVRKHSLNWPSCLLGQVSNLQDC